MRYGTGRSASEDPGSDWFDDDTRQPGGRRERRGGRAHSWPVDDRPGRRTGSAGRSHGGRRPNPPPSTRGRSGFWRKFRSRRPLHQVGYVLATFGAVLIVVIGVGGYTVYQRLIGNIKVIHVGGLSHRSVYGQQNILILGSQERQGQHGHFGQELNPWTTNSDNLLLVHLDATHTHALVLSIPRDTMVYEPGCKARIRQIGTGIMGPYQSTIIDGALNIGGPTCAVTTVEDLTGVKLDHFVEFDFNSFRQMVDAMGGVKVCVPKGGYHDAASGVSLTAGVHKVTYNQALAYVRVRHILGGADAGGDLPRIKVQQAFISSVIQQINSTGVLTNSVALIRLAETATKALTVDQGMSSISELLNLAKSLTGLHSKNVSLVTMPTAYDPADQNRLIPVEPEDDVIFSMILNGTNWHGRLPLAPFHLVQVRVLNGSGVYHLAARTAAQLRRLGFDVVGTGSAAPISSTTVTYSGIAQADDAYTLIHSLRSWPGAQPVVQNLIAEPAPQLGTPGVITLTLGSDYANFLVDRPTTTPGGKSGGSSPPAQAAANSSPSTGPGAVQARNAGSSICSGLPLGNN